MNNIAEVHEIAYHRYARLREIANEVYAPKIEEKKMPGQEQTSFQGVCSAILYDFDATNQSKVAMKLGIPVDTMKQELILLSTGARMEIQGK